MNALSRRLRIVCGVAVAALVVLGGWHRTGVERAGQGPSAPSLRALVTTESDLVVPDRLVMGYDAVNIAGDYATAAGGTLSQVSFTGG